MSVKNKTCANCFISKSVSDFADNPTCRTGLDSTCKQCRKELKRAAQDRPVDLGRHDIRPSESDMNRMNDILRKGLR